MRRSAVGRLPECDRSNGVAFTHRGHRGADIVFDLTGITPPAGR